MSDDENSYGLQIYKFKIYLFAWFIISFKWNGSNVLDPVSHDIYSLHETILINSLSSVKSLGLKFECFTNLTDIATGSLSLRFNFGSTLNS